MSIPNNNNHAGYCGHNGITPASKIDKNWQKLKGARPDLSQIINCWRFTINNVSTEFGAPVHEIAAVTKQFYWLTPRKRFCYKDKRSQIAIGRERTIQRRVGLPCIRCPPDNRRHGTDSTDPERRTQLFRRHLGRQIWIHRNSFCNTRQSTDNVLLSAF